MNRRDFIKVLGCLAIGTGTVVILKRILPRGDRSHVNANKTSGIQMLDSQRAECRLCRSRCVITQNVPGRCGIPWLELNRATPLSPRT